MRWSKAKLSYSPAGNCAVMQLSGQAYPGIHGQGDTLAALRMQLAEAARTLRDVPGNVDVLRARIPTSLLIGVVAPERLRQIRAPGAPRKKSAIDV